VGDISLPIGSAPRFYSPQLRRSRSVYAEASAMTPPTRLEFRMLLFQHVYNSGPYRVLPKIPFFASCGEPLLLEIKVQSATSSRFIEYVEPLSVPWVLELGAGSTHNGPHFVHSHSRLKLIEDGASHSLTEDETANEQHT
jgi:hypothetical protein